MRIVPSFLFFNDPPPSEIYTLSLHDALPISRADRADHVEPVEREHFQRFLAAVGVGTQARSEEHTSELQSRRDLVCRLLLEKKKIKRIVPSIASSEVQPLLSP